MTDKKVDEILERELESLAKDTGDPVFAELAAQLRKQQVQEAVARQLETGRAWALARMKSPSGEVH